MTTSLIDPEEQYKKSAELKREDVKILREWVEKQAHLPNISGETMFFLVCVHVCVTYTCV